MATYDAAVIYFERVVDSPMSVKPIAAKDEGLRKRLTARQRRISLDCDGRLDLTAHVFLSGSIDPSRLRTDCDWSDDQMGNTGARLHKVHVRFDVDRSVRSLTAF
jgi:hypothetical protein